MPRPSNTDHRQQEIVAAFGRLVARQGYDGTPVAAIAGEAGLTPGLVHYHFRRKLDILIRYIRTIAERRAAIVTARVAAASGPAAALDAFIDAHLAVGPDADPEELGGWVIAQAEALRNEEVRRALEAAQRPMAHQLQELILAGQRAGVWGGIDGAEPAAAILATIVGYVSLAATSASLIPAGSAARSLRRMARGLLLPAPTEEVPT